MAEPTYEQILQALQAADAAGNVDDARQLAQMAASMMPKTEAPQEQPQPKSTTSQGSFGRRLASLADVTVGGVLPAVAQQVAYPLARIGRSPEEAQAATERVVSAIDKPFGKAASYFTGTDITATPEYKGEASRQLMDFIGANIQKGSKWLSENTGIPQADIENYIGLGTIAAAPAAKAGFNAAAPIIKETASTIKTGVQAPFEAQIKARNQRLSSEDYARGPQIEAAQEAQRLGIALKPTDIKRTAGTKITTALGGETGLERIAEANIPNVRKVALNEMDLPPDTQLNKVISFNDARSKLAKPYNDIRSLPTMVADQTTIDALEALRPDTALIGKENFATKLNKDIDLAIENVSKGLDGSQLLKNIQTLRKDARRTYNNKNSDVAALDKADAQLAMASVLENMVESNVRDPKLLTRFRDARQKMAKVYAYEGATDFNTGVIDVKRLAKITAKDNMLTGDIASLGKIAGNFPDAFTTKPVKQGIDQASLGRTGLAGTLGGLAGYALGEGYAGAALGSLLGAGVGELAQSAAARRMTNPAYQASLKIRDKRIPVEKPTVETPPIPQNRAVVPYQAPVEVLPPLAKEYQPNFTIPQGTPVRTRAPYTPMDTYLPAPSAESTMAAMRAEDARRAAVSRTLGKEAELKAAAVEASERQPTRGGSVLTLDPITGKLTIGAEGSRSMTPNIQVISSTGNSLQSAATKMAGMPTESTKTQYSQFLNTKTGAPIVRQFSRTKETGNTGPQAFSLTAEERIAWEKAKVDLAEAMPSFKVLSNKALAERMLDRQWVAEAASKAREKALMFEQAAYRAKTMQDVQAAKANRERMLDLADQMENQLRNARPDLSNKVQGPKTRNAFREGLFSTK